MHEYEPSDEENISPYISMTLTIDASQLQDIIRFYHSLTGHYVTDRTLNDNNFDNPFFFNTKLMKHVNNFTSTYYSREKFLWEEITDCHNNINVSRRMIIRKLKFKPLSIALRIYNVSTELAIIRANYFCYTYNELMYILYVVNMYNKDSDWILVSYLETKCHRD